MMTNCAPQDARKRARSRYAAPQRLRCECVSMVAPVPAPDAARTDGARSGSSRRCCVGGATHHATTRACGAAVFIRVVSHRRCRAVSPWQVLTVALRAPLWARCCDRLADDRPADVAAACQEVDVLQVVPEVESAGAGAVEEDGVEVRELLGVLLAVALGEGSAGAARARRTARRCRGRRPRRHVHGRCGGVRHRGPAPPVAGC